MLTATPATALPPKTLEMDDLKVRSFRQLDELYRHLPEPDSVRHLAGRWHGELLAVRGMSRFGLPRLMRAFADSPLFPWQGKRVKDSPRLAGEGSNQLSFPGYSGDHAPFSIRVEDSLVDGRACLALNYDISDNIRLLRSLRDELREVSPGLYMGPATLRFGDRAVVLFYFALSADVA
jgi:hypothetical protein